MKKNLHEITSSVVSLFIHRWHMLNQISEVENTFITHKNNRIEMKRIV